MWVDMAEFLKSILMLVLFVLPIGLVVLAVVCFGRCVSDMLDDREHTSAQAEPRS